MSAFGGVFFFDKNHIVDRSLIESMSHSLENSGRDGSHIHVSGSVGVVYRPFHTTVESYREQQPVVDANFILTFDGRVDNREELADLFGLRGATDVELFVSCYKAWGNDGFCRIIGDFAAAIWNSKARELILVRDPFGVRKVFFVQDEAKIIWSTDITALLNYPGVPATIDEGFVGMSLAFLPDGSVTPFKHIKPVATGHYIVLSKGKSHSQRYWGISFCLGKRTDSRTQLEEELRHLLSRSLKACLRSNKVVTSELSGGLDSSTIVCLAHALLQDSNGSTSRLHTVSHVYDRARQSDERQFISVIEEHIGHPGLHIKEDDHPILSRWPDPLFVSYPNRVHCFGGAVEGIHNAMNSIDSRVLLSGSFGDQLFISHHMLPYEAVDLVREGKYLRAFKACHNWSLRKRQPLLQVIWHGAVRPNLPYWARRAQIHNLQGPPSNTASFRIPSWLDPAFIKRTNLSERIHRVVDGDSKFNAGSRGIRYANLMECVGWFGSGYSQNQMTSGCIEMRYPYLYRPLVEFLISIPYREHCNERTARSLQRAAMKGIVPQSVRTRSDKRGPHEAILFAANREQKALLSLIETSRACSQGYVVQAELIKEAHRWRNGQSMSDMLKFVAVEMWLRALETRRIDYLSTP